MSEFASELLVEFFDDRMRQLVAAGSTVTKLGGAAAGGATWSEGPVYLPRTDQVIWSDIPGNRILCWSANEPDAVSVWRAPSNFTNGHTLDNQGRIIHCSHGARAVLRTEHDGTVTTLVSHSGTARLNSPNDLIVAGDGAIWFTDPPYGILSNHEGYKADQETTGCYVYRLDPETGRLDEIVTDMIHPNGLALSADETVLYVSDTSAAILGDDGYHHLRAYDIEKDGEIHRAVNGRVFAEIDPGLPDGFRLDEFGNLYTSSLDAIQVFAPDGIRIGRIPVPEKIANCCFGGKDRRTMFIAASTSLYSIELLVSDGLSDGRNGLPIT
jgi:gluconolactonase